jgi:hypothetical protein
MLTLRIESNGKRRRAKAKNRRHEVREGPPADLL